MDEIPASRRLVVFVTGLRNDAFGTTTVSESLLAEIRAAVPQVDCRYFPDPREMDPVVGEAEVVYGFIGPQALARATRLKWVQSMSAGPDRLLYPEMVASAVQLTCSKGNGAVPLAEHAMTLMLMLTHGVMRSVRAHAEHRWEHFAHPELNGLTCGIIGLGHCGQDLALKAKAFHMRVLGIRRTAQPTPGVDEVVPRERLGEFLGRSDVVVVTAPRTPETVGMLGEGEFRAMKRSAYYICVSRGGIADDAALLRALRDGWIAGAGLDAHGQEPLPPDSPFWTAPNTIVTPHNGATSPFTRQRGAAIFIDNLKRYVSGQPFVNLVDKHAGY